MSPTDPSADQAASDRPAPVPDEATVLSFLTELHAKLQGRLDAGLSEEVQVELIQINRLMLSTPADVVFRYRFQFEWIFQIIAEAPTEISLIRGLRFNLANVLDRQTSGLPRVLRAICGRTPLTAVISALVTIFVILLVWTVAVSGLHSSAQNAPDEMTHFYYTLLMMKDVPVHSIMIVVHAAFLGSVVSILTRLPGLLNLVVFTPLLIYFSVLTRPLIAVALAIFVFVVMKAGVISTFGADLDGATGSYFLYAIGFLCGFSERFANDIVVRASGPLEGVARTDVAKPAPGPRQG